MNKPYVDNACPPVGDTLQYERGDGAKVTLKIEPAGAQTKPAPATGTPPLLQERTSQPHGMPAPTAVHAANAANVVTAGPIRRAAVPEPTVITPPPRVDARSPGGGTQVRVVMPQQLAGSSLEGRGAKSPPVVATQATGTQTLLNESVYTHPDVGDRFTVFVLFYGPEKWYEMHVKCIDAILQTVPATRLDLRVGTNELNVKSMAMLRSHVDAGRITKIYENATNRYKYPVMRDMFHDPSCPIMTKWVIWFDDDSICDVDPLWLPRLASLIGQKHRSESVHMFGPVRLYTALTPAEVSWMESRPWFKGKPWRNSHGKPSSHEHIIHFCVGAFFAVTKEAIDTLSIPDAELVNNGGDFTIGEMLYQGGYNIASFSSKKQFINWSSVKFRNPRQPHPGTLEWKRLKAEMAGQIPPPAANTVRKRVFIPTAVPATSPPAAQRPATIPPKVIQMPVRRPVVRRGR